MKHILYPTKKYLILISLFSYIALALVFLLKKTRSLLAYPIYVMSAYSLLIICLALIKTFQQSKFLNKVLSSKVIKRYLSDLSLQGNINIYQGIIISFFYVLFRMITGIYYQSFWFISIAVYYLVLGVIRLYLIKSHQDETKIYRNVAWSLFLLNIPMGGMIILMIRTNSGFSYPGYVIYLSALYTFYSFIISIRNIVKFRQVGSPILSSAKVINFISAMMSVLGLQTAMISKFSSHGEAYRQMMNMITGGTIYSIVIIIALYMLIHSHKLNNFQV